MSNPYIGEIRLFGGNFAGIALSPEAPTVYSVART